MACLHVMEAAMAEIQNNIFNSTTEIRPEGNKVYHCCSLNARSVKKYLRQWFKNVYGVKFHP